MPNISALSLNKLERIYLRNEIDELFRSGGSFFLPHFRCVYTINDASDSIKSRGIVVRMMVSVSKRYHKRAVRRNRVKRLIKEAYRLNKSEAYDIFGNLDGKVVNICYIYLGKEELTFDIIENEVKQSFKKIEKISNIHPISID